MFSLSSRYSFTCHVNTISDLNKLCGVGSAECIYEYKSKRCEREIVFPVQYKVVCTAYKRNFDAKWQFILITICPVLFKKSPIAAILITHVLIGSKFSAITRKYRILFGHVHKLNTSLLPDVFLNNLIWIIILKLNNKNWVKI